MKLHLLPSFAFLFMVLCWLSEALVRGPSKYHPRYPWDAKPQPQFGSNPTVSRVVEEVLDAVADFIAYAVKPEERVGGNYHVAMENRLDKKPRDNELSIGDPTDNPILNLLPEWLLGRRSEPYPNQSPAPLKKDKFKSFLEFVSPLLALVWLLFSGPPTVIDIPARRIKRREAEEIEKQHPLLHNQDLFQEIALNNIKKNNATKNPQPKYLRLKGSNGRFIAYSTRSFNSNNGINNPSSKIKKVPIRILNLHSNNK